MRAAGIQSAEASNATYETRFLDNGEIYFCIAFILKYAPFIDRISVVTDDQSPLRIGDFATDGICEPDKIKVVSHGEIFRGHEDCLPTFKSLSIETMLWRIKGLAETFLYFNDDFFLNGPVTLADFYDDKGRVRVYGRERSVRPLKVKLALRRFRYKLMRKGMLPAHY